MQQSRAEQSRAHDLFDGALQERTSLQGKAAYPVAISSTHVAASHVFGRVPVTGSSLNQRVQQTLKPSKSSQHAATSPVSHGTITDTKDFI